LKAGLDGFKELRWGGNGNEKFVNHVTKDPVEHANHHVIEFFERDRFLSVGKVRGAE
jgi:hypothetical protein